MSTIFSQPPASTPAPVKSRSLGTKFFVLFVLAVVMSIVGASASFAAVAAAMYFTRYVDWYSAGRHPTPATAGGATATSPRESWLE